MLIPQAHVTDAYGASASDLLRPIQVDLGSLASELTEKFYGFLTAQGKAAEIIHRLSPEALDRLKKQQAKYLAKLLSDGLTLEAHLEAALNAGTVHALEDIETRWLVDGYGFYQKEIHEMLKERVPDSNTREMILRVIAQRFLQDMEGQASSYKQTIVDVTMAFSRIDQHVMSTSNLTDLIRGGLEVIGNLPGGVSVFFARVDDAGVIQIEQSYGDAAEKYHRAMEDGAVPKFSVDPEIPTGNGPGGRAWRSGEIIVTDAWLVESDIAPWQEFGKALGFRSSAAIPILDLSGRSIALLSLYSRWLGYFSSQSVRSFLDHVQHILSYGIQQRMNAPVVPLREQQNYRTLLSEQGILMYYQPVISLHDGELVKIEGLSRLRNQNNELVLPERFLPAMGRDELLKLFELGMQKICRDFRTLQSQGIDTKIAINLPAMGLDDPRYEQSFFDALGKFDLKPDHFQLEILETKGTDEKLSLHRAFMQRLQAAGVRIAQDDLGSGHSSLLRLDQYPFDEVKIDQGLVRSSLHNPKRAVEFILYLTSLAHAFNTPVTVEGLENLGMIEAAAILGADFGQGYGIGKPMPLGELPAWLRGYNYTVNPKEPRTAIGALAGFLLWDMQLATIAERPELATEFVGAKAIVDHFIDANNLQDSLIESLLVRIHECVVSDNYQSESMKAIRAQVIDELVTYCLNER